MRASEIEEGIFKKIKNTFTGPSRQQVWNKRLGKAGASGPATPEPAAPTAPTASAAPTSASGTVGASFVQPARATATAKAAPVAAAPQAKPRMSVRAATGPAYNVGQKITVGGVFYTWDGQVWRDPKGNPATQGITAAISQQSGQTS